MENSGPGPEPERKGLQRTFVNHGDGPDDFEEEYLDRFCEYVGALKHCDTVYEQLQLTDCALNARVHYKDGPRLMESEK